MYVWDGSLHSYMCIFMLKDNEFRFCYILWARSVAEKYDTYLPSHIWGRICFCLRDLEKTNLYN